MKMKWFRVKRPKDPGELFLGRTLTAYPTIEDTRKRTNGVRLKVEHIAGNLTHQTCFQINGSHLVSMLDAFSELNKEPLPNQDLHEGFMSMVSERVVREENPMEVEGKVTDVET